MVSYNFVSFCFQQLHTACLNRLLRLCLECFSVWQSSSLGDEVDTGIDVALQLGQALIEEFLLSSIDGSNVVDGTDSSLRLRDVRESQLYKRKRINSCNHERTYGESDGGREVSDTLVSVERGLDYMNHSRHYQRQIRRTQVKKKGEVFYRKCRS